ncbi:hypothetical protein HMSSN139_21520 [Paenibacillus sp. HMSSN-139]|nr:hypothetical protein HMSSN139_21520 [Paenibacillus sp. HMSSN-139]
MNMGIGHRLNKWHLITSSEELMKMKKSGWANPITEITLFVADLQRSKVFYQETFQLAIHYEDADCTVFNFGNTCINLLNENNAPELIEPAQVGRVGGGDTVSVHDPSVGH